ncbi:MAG: C1 family peptidase [Bacillota bacterium]
MFKSAEWCLAMGMMLAVLIAAASVGGAAMNGGEAGDSQDAAVDLRAVLRNWALPARSQGGRGTCSVFTMTGAIEYALAKQEGHGTRLSTEFLNWASNAATRTSADGGFFSDLWRGFVAYGVCAEAEMPYQEKFDGSLHPSEAALQHAREVRNVGLQLHWIKRWDVKTGLTESQFAQIKKTLAEHWPVCGGFRWPKRERWNGGVLEMTMPENVFDGHSVLLVGFRDDPTQRGGGVFLIRNSAGGSDDGAMSYEYVRAYMNDAVWVEGKKK